MKRVAEIFLTGNDEELLIAAIRSRFQSVGIIDSIPWESGYTPPVRESISDCSKLVSIWNPETHPSLPSEIRTNGKIYGPQIGPVVQWVRSIEGPPGVLQVGRWAASVDQSDSAMKEFVKELWRILALRTSKEKGFFVGDGALGLANSGMLNLRAGYLQVLP
ncbi:hypothetical protein ACIQBJ_28135 [Kitasatospora sp. NPDC088391]|uniref:hypothetical protein n=1 Tax=Kitasatospora sp. NPDC088391 TaxID=3364074 RepID=UPI0037F15B30